MEELLSNPSKVNNIAGGIGRFSPLNTVKSKRKERIYFPSVDGGSRFFTAIDAIIEIARIKTMAIHVNTV